MAENKRKKKSMKTALHGKKKKVERERGGKWLIEVNTQNIVIVATQNNCNVLYCIVL